MQRSLVLGLGATLFVPLVVFPLWISVHSRDIADAGDADLAVEVPRVAPEDNGFERVRRAADATRISEGERVRLIKFTVGAASDAHWVEGILAAHSAALAELERSLDAPSFVYPPKPDTDPAGDPSGALDAAEKLACLAGADAQRLVDRGSLEAARARALFVIRLGHRLADAANPGLAEMRTALAVQETGLSGLAEVTRRGRLAPDEAARLVAELDSNRIPAARWKDMWAAEYQAAKWSIRRFRASPDAFGGLELEKSTRPLFPLESKFTYHPNRTAALFADEARALQRESETPCIDRGQLDPDESSERIARAMLFGNAIGVWVSELAMPSAQYWNLRRCYVDSVTSLAQTAIALRARWDAEHTLPESLDELVPRYLPAVPSDAFGGEPIRYDAEARALHSIGSNFKSERSKFRTPEDELEPIVSVAFE